MIWQHSVKVLLEYVGGGDLQHYVESDGQQKIALDVLRAYTIQLLDALTFLHSKDMVHRDIRVSSQHSLLQCLSWSVLPYRHSDGNTVCTYFCGRSLFSPEHCKVTAWRILFILHVQKPWGVDVSFGGYDPPTHDLYEETSQGIILILSRTIVQWLFSEVTDEFDKMKINMNHKANCTH